VNARSEDLVRARGRRVGQLFCREGRLHLSFPSGPG
jgi:hypothetical protein